MASKKINHGGKRLNAGRKKKEPTKVMRIPISKLEAVIEIIKKRINNQVSL
jgi:hypothetical protein